MTLDRIDRLEIRARGLRFAALRAGAGPRLALVLHGFPDHADSFVDLLRALAAAGFTAVAPYLRGYAPSEPAADGCYDLVELGADVVAMPAALGFRRAAVIGHDWGALSAYAAAGLSPETVSCMVTLAVPPLPLFLRNLARDPAQLRRSGYIGLFQLPGIAERRLAADDFPLIDHLWRTWSPGLAPDPARLAALKATFRAPGTVDAALAYYRHLAPRHLASFRRSLALSRRPLRVPTRILAGQGDGCIGPRMFEGADDLHVLPGVGHFMHLEAPALVHRLVLDFVGTRA